MHSLSLWRCHGAVRALQLLPSCRLSLSSKTHASQDLNSIELTVEEEASASQIKSSLLKARNGSVQNLVQSLGVDCPAIQLTSNIVDSLLFKLGDDWKSALGLFQWAQSRDNYKHTAYACSRIIDLLGKMRQLDQMWDLLPDMHCRGLLTVEIFAKSIRRLAGARRWKDAIMLFDKLDDMGLERNTETMNVLLDALCKEKKIEVARQVFLVLSPPIQPDAYTFNIFVHGWCSARKIDEAKWTIDEMKSRGFPPSVITYTALLEAYCKQEKFRMAYEVLDSMCSEGCHPNVITYTMIMTSLAKCNMFEDALSISHRMKSSGCKPDTLYYNSLINLLGKAGHLSEASQVFKVEMPMNGVPHSLATYNTMISIFCQKNRDEDALNVLKEMEAQSCKPDIQTYRPLLRLFLNRRGQHGTIRNLLDEFVNKHSLGLDVDTYSLLIHGLYRVGETDWAYQLFEEMVGSEIGPRYKTWDLLLSDAQSKNMERRVEKIRHYMTCFGI